MKNIFIAMILVSLSGCCLFKKDEPKSIEVKKEEPKKEIKKSAAKVEKK